MNTLLIRQRDVLQTKHHQRERELILLMILMYYLTNYTMNTKPHQSIGDCAQHNKTFE